MVSERLIFALQNYGSLAIFALAFWGFGKTAVAYITHSETADHWLNNAIALTVGIGIFTVALQWIAIAGGLRRSNINVMLVLGLILACRNMYLLFKKIPVVIKTRISLIERLYALPPIILLIPTVLAALHPPYKWDELMYHLPHAQQWAETGKLQVNEWLRYPWAPYNINILYAAGFIIRGDVFTHLLHAIAGWLVAIMVYRFSVINCGRATACMAASLWLLLTQKEYDSSMIDMGVSLFIFTSVIAYIQWINFKEDSGWIVLSGFMLGMAVGSKYQSLGFLPLFLAYIILNTKNTRIISLWILSVSIPCIYWYGRNIIYTGNPFNPLGGGVFGYYDWNAIDMEYQFYDLQKSANWPHWSLWFACLMPFFKESRRNSSYKFMMIFSTYGFLIWIITSHYDRYLMPIYPILAIIGVNSIIKITGISSVSGIGIIKNKNTVFISVLLLIIISIISLIGKIEQKWQEIAINEMVRDAVLGSKVKGYTTVKKIQKISHSKIYQFGFENLIYYIPHPVYGDHFGSWRYRDFDGLTPDKLSDKLLSKGFSTLLANSTRVLELEKNTNFFNYFSVIAEENGNKAYSIIESKNEN